MRIHSHKHNLRGLARTIGYVYKQDPLLAGIRDLAFVISTGLEMVQIAVGGKFIDATAEILLDGQLNGLQDYFYTESFQWLATALGIWIVMNGLNRLRSHLKLKLERDVVHQANLDIMNKISSENQQEIEQRDFQELITFVPGYSVSRIMSVYDAFSESMRHLISLVTAFIILSQTMGPSALLLILFAIPEPVMQFIDEKRIRNYRREEVEGIKFVEYLKSVAFRIPNFSELRVNGIFSFLKRTFRKEDRDYQDGIVEMNRRYNSDQAVFSTFGQILKYGYIIYVLFTSVTKKLSIGDFKALYDYTGKVYSSAYNFVRQLFVIFNNASYTIEFFDFLDYEGFGDMDSGKYKLKEGTPKIELKDLDFFYQDDPDTKVLENVTVTIEPGENVAFVGEDGSGKSSLVKTLCGLYEIKAGDYVLDGYSARELKRGELKKKIAVVFQNFVRYNFTIKKNITISSERSRADLELYEKVKKVAQVDKFMKKEKIDDKQILGKYFTGGREISPGHWQRLAIARMLYRNRDIFILDEPFTFIDGISREKILKNIIKFSGKDKTVVYITQNTDNLDLFDKVFFIHHGKILERGTYVQLMRKHGKFYEAAMANR